MDLERRTVLQAGGVVAIGGLVAACGSSSSASTTSAAGSAGAGSAAAGAGSTKAADVPVGGGVVIEGAVITQPKAGEFKAFSSACTHQGCAVSGVKDNVISCPCHGSQFSAEDGSVVKGPASSPLPAKTVTVNGGELTVT